MHLNGYIELPDAAELPVEGSILTLGKVRVEVTGNHRDKQKRRGEAVEWVYTAPTTLLEGANISKLEPAPDDPELPLDGEGGGNTEAKVGPVTPADV